MEKELISIVLTSYNHKEYIEKAITQILNQTYENIELIIVDDCSTDGSQEIIKKYQNYNNVKIILLDKNLGSYVKSTNYGAKYASGKYINFAQCDDYSDIFLLEKLHKALKQNTECGVAYSASYMIDENNTIIGDDYSLRSKRFKERVSSSPVIHGNDFRTLLYESCVIPNLSAVLIKKDLFISIGGLSDNYFVLADWDMWIRISYHTDFFYIKEKLNFFRQHSTTIRSKISIKRQLKELIQMFASNKLNNKISYKENLFICYTLIGIIISFICQTNNKKGVIPYACWISLKYSPLIPLLAPFYIIKKIFLRIFKICK